MFSKKSASKSKSTGSTSTPAPPRPPSTEVPPRRRRSSSSKGRRRRSGTTRRADATLKYADELLATAKHMTAPGKGLLAADESTGTIKKRFDDIGVENTEANRQAYRQLLFTTPKIGDYISGAILFDETIRQSSTDGKKFVDMLNAAGVIPGIKLDQGMVDLDNYPGDKCTQGLDNLGKRAAEYYALGARFAKWRAVYHITDSIPSNFCYKAQAYGLARYAAICQANGLVPIVEPEVIMDGSHSIERSYEVTYTAQAELFKALNDHMVDLERIILKPNMVIPGYENGAASKETVAEWTLKCLRNTTPPSVPGIMFLSGGQSELDSTVNLDAMNKSSVLKPWALSFSYGRALQASALKAWGGKPENVAAGQAAFTKRAVANFHAAKGTWTDELEK